jgi:hypothetical protein
MDIFNVSHGHRQENAFVMHANETLGAKSTKGNYTRGAGEVS